MTDSRSQDLRTVALSLFPMIGTAALAIGAALVLIWGFFGYFHLDESDALVASLIACLLGVSAVVWRFASEGQPLALKNDLNPSRARGQSTALHDLALTNHATPPNVGRWSMDVFASMDSKRFAAVCETWFSWAGFDTRCETHRTNEGVDIWLHAARMTGPVAVVRCKHWRNKPVGLQEMKEFLGLVATSQPAHGTYTTTSTYTPEALEFARVNGIDAVDGRGLLRRIQTRTQQRQQALLAVACSSDP